MAMTAVTNHYTYQTSTLYKFREIAAATYRENANLLSIQQMYNAVLFISNLKINHESPMLSKCKKMALGCSNSHAKLVSSER